MRVRPCKQAGTGITVGSALAAPTTPALRIQLALRPVHEAGRDLGGITVTNVSPVNIPTAKCAGVTLARTIGDSGYPDCAKALLEELVFKVV